MLSGMDKRKLERMVNFVCFSPVFYGALAWALAGYRLNVGVDLRYLVDYSLAGCFVVILISRPVQRAFLPPEKPLTVRRVSGTAMLVAGLGEAISASGALVVWLGAPLQACLPFLALGALYMLDFRFARLPLIFGRWPEE